MQHTHTLRFGQGARVIGEPKLTRERELLLFVVLARHMVRRCNGEVNCDDEVQALEIQRKRHTRVRRRPGGDVQHGVLAVPLTRKGQYLVLIKGCATERQPKHGKAH